MREELKLLYTGQYKELFEKTKGEEATVYDYHTLYSWCLRELVPVVFSKNYYHYRYLLPVIESSSTERIVSLLRKLPKDNEISLENRLSYFNDERARLECVFDSFVGENESLDGSQKKLDEIKNTVDSIHESLESRTIVPKVICELIEAMKLDPKPINGRYKIAGISDREFVNWIVKEKYSEFLTQDNYFTYIHSEIKEETIKRYYREAEELERINPA